MRNRSHLLVLPVGLAATHLLLSTLGLLDSDGVAQWSPQVVRALACVGLPLALIAVALALTSGFKNRAAPARPSSIIASQLAGFLALDAVEHGFSLRVTCSRSFWIALSAHAAVALTTWLTLRLSRCVGRGFARAAARASASPAPQARLGSSFTAIAAMVVPVGSLSRRGPPTSNRLLFS